MDSSLRPAGTAVCEDAFATWPADQFRKVEIWALPARLAEAVITRAERAAGLSERLASSDAMDRAEAASVAKPSPISEPVADQLSLF